MKRNSILAESAFFIALSVVLTRFLSLKISVYGIDGVRIGLGTLPIILAGLRWGALNGAKVGALADIAGYMLSPGGPYIPVFTLTSALNGALPPLLIGKKEHITYMRIFIAISLTHFVLSLVVVPYFLFLIFGIPFKLVVLPRFVSFLLNVFLLNYIIIYLHRRNKILVPSIPSEAA